jgi:hypothetical protein
VDHRQRAYRTRAASQGRRRVSWTTQHSPRSPSRRRPKHSLHVGLDGTAPKVQTGVPTCFGSGSTAAPNARSPFPHPEGSFRTKARDSAKSAAWERSTPCGAGGTIHERKVCVKGSRLEVDAVDPRTPSEE